MMAFFHNVKADIIVTDPPNWQPSPENNSTAMSWIQNSTQSIFTIARIPLEFNFGLFLFVGVMAQGLAESGMLESMDQITFGHSNFGYRFLLNTSSPTMNLSSPNVPSSLTNNPFTIGGPIKASIILSQKYNSTYAVALLTPSVNFERISNELKPTLDSIQITKPAPSDTKINWKEYNNSTFGLTLEYPATWTVDPKWEGNYPYNSICDPATGTCFNIIVAMESGFTNADLDEVSRIMLNSSINASLGDRLLSPLQMANYTIDGERAEVFTKLLTIPNTDVVAEQQNIIVIHNGKVYNFEFGGHFSAFSEPDVKKIGEHIIKSIKFTEPTCVGSWPTCPI